MKMAARGQTRVGNGETMNKDTWATQPLRQKMIGEIEKIMAHCNYPVNRTSAQMEGYIYQQATSREEYISMTARVIIHIREMVDWRYQLEDVHGLFCPNYDITEDK